MTPDRIYSDPRQAAVYDAFDADRRDLDAYVAVAGELGATSVLDVGCGTGNLALLLADAGLDVVGVDPATASLEVARARAGASRVRWIDGDATTLPDLQVDLATMTGNVAQVFVADATWTDTLAGIHAALRPGGHVYFETRIPDDRAWERWTPAGTRQRSEVRDLGVVTRWVEVLEVALPLATFRTVTELPDGERLESRSTLRFRSRAEVEESLATAGFELVDVRDAPDRPGREWVFLARR